MRKYIGIHLFVVSLALIYAALFVEFDGSSLDWLIRMGFLLAAADLLCTVFGRPLIGPGPIAKAIYPNLDE